MIKLNKFILVLRSIFAIFLIENYSNIVLWLPSTDKVNFFISFLVKPLTVGPH